MTKEKAIMELSTVSMMEQAVESAIKLLEDFEPLQELINPLEEKGLELEAEAGRLMEIINDGPIDIEKALLANLSDQEDV